jgi:hypothetical protein
VLHDAIEHEAEAKQTNWEYLTCLLIVLYFGIGADEDYLLSPFPRDFYLQYERSFQHGDWSKRPAGSAQYQHRWELHNKTVKPSCSMDHCDNSSLPFCLFSTIASLRITEK